MPHPSTVHTDKALSTFISGYDNGEYVADLVAPIVESDKRSDAFQQFALKDTITQYEAALSPTGEANEADYSISTGNYSVKDYGLVGHVSNAELMNADEPHRPLEKRARFLMNNIMLGREIRVANLFGTTGNYASTNHSAAAVAWTNQNTGNPLADIETALNALPPGMEDKMQTVMVIAQEVWMVLRRHPVMLGGGAISSTLSLEQAAQTLGIDRIIVSKAIRNSALEGLAVVKARIWTATQAVIARVPVGDPVDETGLFAASFRFTGGASGEPVEVRRWQSPQRGRGGSESIQVELSEDVKVVQNDMAYLLTGVR